MQGSKAASLVEEAPWLPLPEPHGLHTQRPGARRTLSTALIWCTGRNIPPAQHFCRKGVAGSCAILPVVPPSCLLPSLVVPPSTAANQSKQGSSCTLRNQGPSRCVQGTLTIGAHLSEHGTKQCIAQQGSGLSCRHCPMLLGQAGGADPAPSCPTARCGPQASSPWPENRMCLAADVEVINC